MKYWAKIDKKILAIVLLSLALIIVSYIAFKPSPLPYDKKFVDGQINDIIKDKDSLLNVISNLQKQKDKDLLIIDSLQKLKPKIQLIYVEKYKEIDNANVNGIITDFQGVFSENNIKR